jgi:DNA invertase Pin-like site-specific DNA recombinase
MKIGYARVSTDDQNLDLQKDALTRAGCERIYEEKASGGNAERIELSACLKSLRKGDTLVCWKLDRLGRSLQDLVRIIDGLRAQGIAFESLTEKIDTSSATGALIFHIFASLAEFERALIRDRTNAGLAAARARGRVGGRPKKLSDKQIEAARILIAAKTLTMEEIAKQYGVSRGTLYRSL